MGKRIFVPAGRRTNDWTPHFCVLSPTLSDDLRHLERDLFVSGLPKRSKRSEISVETSELIVEKLECSKAATEKKKNADIPSLYVPIADKSPTQPMYSTCENEQSLKAAIQSLSQTIRHFGVLLSAAPRSSQMELTLNIKSLLEMYRRLLEKYRRIGGDRRRLMSQLHNSVDTLDEALRDSLLSNQTIN